MNAKQLAQQAKTKNNNWTIIDVREKAKFAAFHLPHAINIEPFELFMNPEKHLQKNHKYYLICNSNNTAASLVKNLAPQGYQVEDVKGGMNQLLAEKNDH